MSRYLSFSPVFLFLLIVSCQKEQSFEQGIPAQGSLQGNFGDCLAKKIGGIYTATKSLADTNYIDVEVDVTKAGRYTIYTDTINGYFFRATGNFTAVGSNSVRLKGFGTPASAGTNDFIVVFDSSFCNLSVTVLPNGGNTGGTGSADHFILTDNSWWSYSIPIPNDTLKRTILSGSFNDGSVSYKGMKEFDAARQIVDDTLFFRKSGNNYYELNFVDYYTSFYLDNPVTDSILFLKEGLTLGFTWSSPVYTGTEGGATRKIRYDFKCDNNNATVPLNSKTYTNVYQITMKVMVDSGTGFQPDVTWTNYYAQGIGWIYQKGDDGSGSPYEASIKNYKIF
jgi:hypothetical protein